VVTTEVAIAAATVAAVDMLGAPLVVVFTKSGFSARVVASKRPPVPILALTDEPRTFRQLALVWGVVPELVPHCADYDEMMERTKEVVSHRELASTGDRIIVPAGVPSTCLAPPSAQGGDRLKLHFLGREQLWHPPDWMCVRSVQVDRPQGQTNARWRAGGDDGGTNILIDTPPELRLQLNCGRRQSC